MSAVTHSHKRALEWMAVNFSPDLHQAASPKKLSRTKPDHIGPTAAVSRASTPFFSNILLFMGLTAILEAGRQDFRDATGDVPPHRSSAKPPTHGWSVLECIEHVAAVEDRYQNWILTGTAIAPRRDADKELRLFTTIRSRFTKVEAPDVVRPWGRFRALPEALAEFEAVRGRSVQLVEERGDALYSIGAKHPYFGELNGAEWMHLIDGHARRHAEQIREICEALLEQEESRKKAVR